jgi:hypothetical protein
MRPSSTVGLRCISATSSLVPTLFSLHRDTWHTTAIRHDGTMDLMNDDSDPPDQTPMLKFAVRQTSASECAARLGHLALGGRNPISTPHFIVPTSRGSIPHLSPDNLQKHTDISAVYVPLEDCMLSPLHSQHPCQMIADMCFCVWLTVLVDEQSLKSRPHPSIARPPRMGTPP